MQCLSILVTKNVLSKWRPTRPPPRNKQTLTPSEILFSPFRAHANRPITSRTRLSILSANVQQPFRLILSRPIGAQQRLS